MKKVLVMAMSLAIVSAGIIACKKDNQPQVGPQQGNPKISKYTVKTEQVPATIGSFLKSYALTPQRDGAPQPNMELGEALWNLEAAVNYHFRSEKDLIEQRATYTHEFDLPIVVNGNYYEATAADIHTAYTNAIDFVSQALTTNNEDEKVLVADFYIVSNTDNIAKFKIELLSYIEVGRSIYALDSTDYWYFVFPRTKCGPYEGQGHGNAIERIHEILNSALPIGDYYFTDVFKTSPIITYYDESGLLCFPIYLYNHCMSPDLIQYYLDKARYVIQDYAEENCPNHEMINCWYRRKGIGTNDNYQGSFKYIKYGISHKYSDDILIDFSL